MVLKYSEGKLLQLKYLTNKLMYVHAYRHLIIIIIHIH